VAESATKSVPAADAEQLLRHFVSVRVSVWVVEVWELVGVVDRSYAKYLYHH